MTPQTLPFSFGPNAFNSSQLYPDAPAPSEKNISNPPNNIVGQALRFAAATYEKQDGTDERAVFDILQELSSAGTGAQREFEETLIAMAKANQERGRSYYEEVRSGSSKGSFVESVLEYEMRGLWISSEYRQAMAIWKADPREVYQPNALEDFSEGLLNSVANMAEASLQHEIVTGIFVGVGAGLFLSGTLPLVATSSAGLRVLAALPSVARGLHYFGNLSGGFFASTGILETREAWVQDNPYRRAELWRKAGESLGTAALSFSWGKSSKKFSQNETLSNTQKSSNRALVRQEMHLGLDEMPPDHPDRAKRLSSFFKKLEEKYNYTYFLLRIRTLDSLENSDLALVDEKTLFETYQTLKEANLDLAIRIYQNAPAKTRVRTKWQFLFYAIGLSPAGREKFLAALPKEEDPALKIFQNFLAGLSKETPEKPFSHLIDLLELSLRYLRSPIGNNESHGLGATQIVYRAIELARSPAFSRPVQPSDAEIARLVDIVYSNEFNDIKSQSFANDWSQILQALDLKSFPALKMPLQLELFSNPGNQIAANNLDLINMLEALRSTEVGEVIRLRTYSAEVRPRFGWNFGEQKRRSYVFTPVQDPSNHYIFSYQGPGHPERGFQWAGKPLNNGSYQITVTHRGDPTHECTILSRDYEKIEEAFFSLLERTEHDGNLFAIPREQYANPLPHLQNENGEPIISITEAL